MSDTLLRQLQDIERIATQADVITGRCPHDRTVACGNCRLEAICLPAALGPKDLERFDAIIQRGRPLHSGDHLYRQDEAFSAVFAVRSGTLKSYHLNADGREQITGFFLPGEIVGTDGIGRGCHVNSVIALETASICAIPFKQLEALSSEVPDLLHRVMSLLSDEILREQRLLALLTSCDADQRIAAFLLRISARCTDLQHSATRLRLPMSRSDIGSYLGLRVETVSRAFTRMHKQGLIAVAGKEVTLLQLDKLRAMVSEG